MRSGRGAPGGGGVAKSRPLAHDDGYHATSPDRGAGHGIIAPARLPVPYLRLLRPLAGPPHGGPPAPAAVRRPPRQRPPHRHLLVPRLRHLRRVPPGLPRRPRLRPAL